MKILVPQKLILDVANVAHDSQKVERAFTGNKVVNPFCSVALEAAVRLREIANVSEIVAVTVGSADSQKMLARSLAAGADRALLIDTRDSDEFLPLDLAKLLSKVVSLEKPDLILMGRQGVDYDNNQVGQMLSALLDWPIINSASKISMIEGRLNVEHEMDEGVQVHALPFPGIITVSLLLNDPRVPGLADTMKARNKPLTIIPCEQLLHQRKRHIEVVDISTSQRNGSLTMLDDIKGLADVIRAHAQRH